jgi:hypothetical protein
LTVLSLLSVVYALSAAHRYLVNDDYQILHTAWLRASGRVPGRDFAIYSYHLIVDLLTPLFRWFPDSFVPLFAGRIVLLAVLCAIAWMLFALGGMWFNPLTGWIAPVLALSTQAMLYRALDLRPDLLTTMMWLGILLILTGARPLSRRSLLLLGAVTATVLVNRFKAVLILPLCVTVLGRHVFIETTDTRGRWAAVVRSACRASGWFLAGFAAPILVYLGWLASHAELHTFWATNLALMGVVEGAQAVAGDDIKRTLSASFGQDTPFWLLVGIGIILRITHAKRFSTRLNVLAAGLLALLFGSVVLNPAYYPYNLVTLLPPLALFAAYPISILASGSGRPTLRRGAAALLILAPLLSGGAAMTDAAVRSTIDHQLALERFLLRYTPDGAAVFALEGVGIFRPSVYHWHMPSVLRPFYLHGGIDFSQEMTDARPAIVVTSYRLPAWLLPRDRTFITEHYVPLAPYLLTQGFMLGPGPSRRTSFQVLASARYEVITREGALCLLDGRPVAQGAEVDLARGPHTFEAEQSASCTVRRYFPPDGLRMVANPLHRPYLVPPGLGTIE